MYNNHFEHVWSSTFQQQNKKSNRFTAYYQLKNYNQTGCRHQSLSTDKFAGNFQIYALAKIKTTTIHITYLFNTEQTA
jgi:hypothetical protein